MAREITSLYAAIAGGIGTPGMPGMPGGIPRPMAARMAACAPPGDKTPRYDSGDEPRRRIASRVADRPRSSITPWRMSVWRSSWSIAPLVLTPAAAVEAEHCSGLAA